MTEPSSHYIPEPYQTIIKRLGNAYDTGFFTYGACACLAVILQEAADRKGHDGRIKLVTEAGSVLHHAYFEVEVDGRVYDLDIRGRGAGHRRYLGFTEPVKIIDYPAKPEGQTYEDYLIEFAETYGTHYHKLDINGTRDRSKAFPVVRKIAFDFDW